MNNNTDIELFNLYCMNCESVEEFSCSSTDEEDKIKFICLVCGFEFYYSFKDEEITDE